MSVVTHNRSFSFTPQDSGQVFLIVTTRTFIDGEWIGSTLNHRSILNPASDLNNVQLDNRTRGPLPDDVKNTLLTWWTPERVAKYAAAMAEMATAPQGGNMG
jgi:hypothetical protein